MTMQQTPKTPQPYDSSFNDLPVLWDVDFGYTQLEHVNEYTDARITVRVFCYDVDGNITAVQGKHSAHCYYIPGGGVEDGETLEQAAIREALEESGDTITDLQPIARFINRSRGERVYDIYFFTAKIAGKGHPTTTQLNELNKEVIYLHQQELIELFAKQYRNYTGDSQSSVSKYILEKLILKI